MLLLVLTSAIVGCREDIETPTPRQPAATRVDTRRTIQVGFTDLLGIRFEEDLSTTRLVLTPELVGPFSWVVSGPWVDSDTRQELCLRFFHPAYSRSPDGACEVSFHSVGPGIGPSSRVFEVVFDRDGKEVLFYPVATVGKHDQAPVAATRGMAVACRRIHGLIAF
jgi:hypothetical protein